MCGYIFSDIPITLGELLLSQVSHDVVLGAFRDSLQFFVPTELCVAVV